uniref:Uncharacterized protein n=1 Tax=Chromera velia CCMP2878 TaxID=1169474 RepID=A0A0G4HBB3_9ALVE|eukprot:Cvel_25907.t1-p1 / transcript=Cvel_25907.t1 / gene=Cvel_25907 / organism=Chromera_velia_CCMP2878 / gene_product=hypothetical protein / transcript_product=hypothetical protein / location=Cvel_scaffold2993:16695-18734(+) / protein_length=280 / sequence_SO=supercontig / SO=protein_coding / is_pseudo=false
MRRDVEGAWEERASMRDEVKGGGALSGGVHRGENTYLGVLEVAPGRTPVWRGGSASVESLRGLEERFAKRPVPRPSTGQREEDADYLEPALEMAFRHERPDLGFEILFRFGNEKALLEYLSRLPAHEFHPGLPSRHRVYLLHILSRIFSQQRSALERLVEMPACGMHACRDVEGAGGADDFLDTAAVGGFSCEEHFDAAVSWVEELCVAGAFDPLPTEDKENLQTFFQTLLELRRKGACAPADRDSVRAGNRLGPAVGPLHRSPAMPRAFADGGFSFEPN